MSGIVYALTNKSFPGFVKIGKVGSVQALQTRIRTFNGGAPTSFKLAAAVCVSNEGKVEKLMHRTFDDVRVPSGREFFKVEVEPVKAAMELACLSRGNNMLLHYRTPIHQGISVETKQDAWKNSKVFSWSRQEFERVQS